MPLTAEQTAAIALIAGADAEEVAEALKTDAQPIYQRIFRAGHSTGTEKAKTEKTALETQLQAEKDRAAGFETELADLKAKTPDRAAIDAQWQGKLEKETKKVQEQLDAAQQRIARLTTDTTVEKAENALVAAGFRPKMAKLLAKEHAGRITYGDDGKPILHEPGTTIPVQIPDGRSAFEVLAETEKKTADPADLASNVDTSGGATNGGAAGGYDPVAAGKAMAAQQKATAGDGSLAFK